MTIAAAPRKPASSQFTTRLTGPAPLSPLCVTPVDTFDPVATSSVFDETAPSRPMSSPCVGPAVPESTRLAFSRLLRVRPCAPMARCCTKRGGAFSSRMPPPRLRVSFGLRCVGVGGSLWRVRGVAGVALPFALLLALRGDARAASFSACAKLSRAL